MGGGSTVNNLSDIIIDITDELIEVDNFFINIVDEENMRNLFYNLLNRLFFKLEDKISITEKEYNKINNFIKIIDRQINFKKVNNSEYVNTEIVSTDIYNEFLNGNFQYDNNVQYDLTNLNRNKYLVLLLNRKIKKSDFDVEIVYTNRKTNIIETITSEEFDKDPSKYYFQSKYILKKKNN